MTDRRRRSVRLVFARVGLVGRFGLVGRVALALGIAALGGCAPRPGVLRVEDDAYAIGIAHEPDAYAYTLEGVLAENDGRFVDAVRSYERALAVSGPDRELHTRLYHASCRAAAPGAFGEKKARGRWLDAALERGYAPAFEALANCIERQGKRGDAAALARAREGLVRTSRDPDAVAKAGQHTSPGQGSGAAELELRLEVLVTAHPESREAWLALGDTLEKSGRRLAAAQAYAEYARRQPGERRTMLAKAEAFAAHGDTYGARLLAAAALDAPTLEGAPLGALPAQGTRLAIEEALVRGDERATLRRAARARVPLGEVAAHALLVGNRALAESIARSVLAAGDPDPDAAAVLLALGEPLDDRVTTRPSPGGVRVLERALRNAGVRLAP